MSMDIRYLIAERHINSARISSKSIRLDVYVENQEGTVLDIEMQVTGDNSTVYSDKDEATVIKGLPLRTRYYQSLISMDMLKQGMKYRELRKSYVIFICTFDPFGKGLPMYHFTYRCKEDNTLEMGDLTENIYLNARAADKAEDTALADFLCYVNSGKAGSEFTQAMDLKIIQEDAEKKGRLAGNKEGRIDTAKALKKQGKLSDSEIAEVTALPLREVAAL